MTKLPKEQKILLINQVLAGEKVTDACRRAHVSRAIFYRWMKIYASNRIVGLRKKTYGYKLTKEDEERILSAILQFPSYTPKELSELLHISTNSIWEVLKHNHINTIPKRKKYLDKKGKNIIRMFTVNDKLTMIRQFEKGEKISHICKDYGVSRTAFYKWLKIYKDSTPENKEVFLNSKRRHGENHWRFIKNANEFVLQIVFEHPEYNFRKIANMLTEKNGGKFMSASGIYSVLKRLDLTTYEKRLAYRKAHMSRIVQLPKTEDLKLSSTTKYTFFSFLSPPIERIALPFFEYFFIPFIASFFLSLLLISFAVYIFLGHSILFDIGILFALVSLLLGMFFFIYSLKYYFVIVVVLSFSRHKEEKNPLSFTGFLASLFGISITVESASVHSENVVTHVKHALQANISTVRLERNPFVSIHVSTYNEKRVIDRLLTAVTSMEYDNFEIVVADDSNDETVQLIEKWGKHPRVKISHRATRQGYKGGALREALKVTDPKAEYIMVFDADFIPFPDTIVQFLKYFKATVGSLEEERIRESKVAAVQGYQWHVLNKSENWITRGVRSEFSGSYVMERSGAEIYSGLKQISGSVYAIRRDVLEEIGWGTSITEDFELTLRLYEKGYKVVYTPYIQTPAEAASTIKRLIRQRMRWAEGHSFNVKHMFRRLLFSPKLTLPEKLEFLYLSPYYLQAAFFIVGTFSWLLAEIVFQTRLPFWTDVWGWSLIFTNLLALPLMNMVGLFMEDSEEKDYLGLLSFIALSYIVAPFQAYAAVKGFIEKEEGPWFRTPKTGRITDTFMPGRLSRFIKGIFGKDNGIQRPVQGYSQSVLAYIQVTTANNTFSSFAVAKRQFRWTKQIVAFILIISTLLLNSLAYNVKQANAWFNSNYLFRKQITIDHTKVSGGADLSNFPVLISMTDVNLKTAANGGHVQNSSGFDIIFVASDDVTQLNHEIENYVATTGEIEMWVKIPTLSASADTIIYIYYDNSSISTSQENKTGVWSNGYKGVWHLKESGNGTSGEFKDSTASNNGTGGGGTASQVPSQTTGQIGKGQNFNATNSDIINTTTATGLPVLDASQTITLWYKVTTNPSSEQVIFNPQNSGDTAADQVELTGTNLAITNTSGPNGILVQKAYPTANAWHYISWTWNGTTNSLYTDGGTATTSTTAPQTGTSASIYFGGWTTTVNSQNYNGLLDEVRIANVVRTAGWLTTEYNNQNSPSTFFTVGSEQNVPEFVILLFPLALAAPFIIQHLRRKRRQEYLYTKVEKMV